MRAAKPIETVARSNALDNSPVPQRGLTRCYTMLKITQFVKF